jgi:hypothetical protein
MDPLDLITDPTIRNHAIAIVLAVSAALPVLEWLADRTANKWDNQAVATLRRWLSFIPRARITLGNREQAAATVARVSMAPAPFDPDQVDTIPDRPAAKRPPKIPRN